MLTWRPTAPCVLNEQRQRHPAGCRTFNSSSSTQATCCRGHALPSSHTYNIPGPELLLQHAKNWQKSQELEEVKEVPRDSFRCLVDHDDVCSMCCHRARVPARWLRIFAGLTSRGPSGISWLLLLCRLLGLVLGGERDKFQIDSGLSGKHVVPEDGLSVRSASVNALKSSTIGILEDGSVTTSAWLRVRQDGDATSNCAQQRSHHKVIQAAALFRSCGCRGAEPQLKGSS